MFDLLCEEKTFVLAMESASVGKVKLELDFKGLNIV